MELAPELNFERLPVEIKLQILSGLCCSEILQARRLHKAIQSLIDQNEDAIFRAVQARLVQALQLTVDEILNYDMAKTPFLTALERFIAHRGIWRDGGDRFTDIQTFIAHREVRMYGLRDPYHNWSLSGFGDTTRLARDILEFYIRHQLPALAFPSLRDYREFIQSPPGRRAMVRMQVNEQEITGAYEQILSSDPPAGFVRARIHEEDRYPSTNLLQWPLTRMLYITNQFAVTTRYVDYSSVAELVDLLGVPTIPEMIYCRPEFAYCAKTEWAYTKVREGVKGRPLSSQEKAKVLEEIFLF